MKREVLKGVIFLVLLSFFAASLGNLRSQNKGFLYADSGVSEEYLASMQESSGYWKSYLTFLSGLFSGDLGKTDSEEPVGRHILERIVPTIHLSIFAILWSSVSAIFVSLLVVFTQSTFLRAFLQMVSNLILSTPVFVVAVLLLVMFFLEWDLLPPGGYESGQIRYVILPGVALGSRVFARINQFSLALSSGEEKSAYFKVLESRGYSWSRIIFRHLFWKIFPVLLVFILLDFSSLLSGAIVVEEIYFFPGMGRSLFHAIRTMDTNLLRVLIFYSGCVFYLFNRLAYWIQMYLQGGVRA